MNELVATETFQHFHRREKKNAGGKKRKKRKPLHAAATCFVFSSFLFSHCFISYRLNLVLIPKVELRIRGVHVEELITVFRVKVLASVSESFGFPCEIQPLSGL